MEKRCFLMLVSLSKDTATIGKAFMERVKADIDPNAAPAWIDSRGLGVLISTELPAWQIWQRAYPDSLPRDHLMALKDMLIVQVGPQWAADPSTRPAAWLNSRFPRH